MTLKSARGHSYRAVELALAHLAAQRFPLELITTHRFGLTEVDRAIIRGRPGRVGRHPRIRDAVEITRGLLVKRQLVDAIRMLEHAGMIDHNGHGSARRDDTSFYVNSGASVRGALTIDDIVAVDLGGDLVEGTARPPLEFHIHSEIYRARADVNAVMHTHPQWSTFLTMTGAQYSRSTRRECCSATSP